MNSPKVSVCVVTYNQEKYIGECLQSIVEQVTNFEFEVIIGDDCSTDNTPKIIDFFVQKYSFVKLIKREKNIGAMQNYLEVHSSAQCPFVCHMDGDDRWLQNKLQKQYDFINNHSEFSVVWTRSNFFNDNNGFASGELVDYSIFKDNIVEFEQALRLGSIAVNSSIMYRKSARLTKSYDGTLLDLFYTWEFLSQGKGKIIDHCLTEYRVNANGSVINSNIDFIRKLNYQHAKFFLKKHPNYKKSIFVFALFNFILEAKHRRKTLFLFLKLLVISFTFVSPVKLYCYFQEWRKMKIPQMSKH
jgi:glycosyltransferase involved in cell wall biosynthesis